MKEKIAKRTDRAIADYFEKVLLPSVAGADKEGEGFFPRRPDPEAVSYFKRCEKKTLTGDDFILEGCASFEKLEEALARLWEGQGFQGLAGTAPAAATLARKLNAYAMESENSDISPFMYVMF